MILVKPNSAHYGYQQEYLNYLRNIKVGDTVYPGSDGKGDRCTACKVVGINDNKLVVVGTLYGSDDKVITSVFDSTNGEAWVVYVEEESSLIDYLIDKEEENEDFYQLIMFEGYDISDGYFSDNYLKSLGLK